jgi:integrase
VAAEFVERVLKPRQRRWQATAAVLDNRLTKPWRGRDIASIKKVDVLRVLDRQMDAGQHRSANVALQLARRLFRWSLERDYIAVDPTAGIAKPGKEQARSRVLDDNELAAVLRASEAMGWPFGPFVTLLAMLAQRRGELAQARWQHFDFERQVWNIPAELTKSHRAHQVPLPPEAVAILESLPRLDGNEYLFPAVRDRLQDGRKRSVSGFSRAKARLHQLSGVKGWSYHDLRRSAASGMAKQGAAPHVLAAVLNHDQRSVQGVTSIYNRERYRTEMRRALELWCNHVGTLMADERSNVIPLGA